MKTILSPINEQNGPGPPSPPVATDPTRIDKSLEVNGEVIGSESLYIDGKVKGTINLPGSRVTIGRNGQVSADICAREVVVLGEVQGNIDASERVNITSEGSLIGDVIAQRVSIRKVLSSGASSTSTHLAQEAIIRLLRGSPAPNGSGPLLPFRRRSKQTFDMATGI
jgi:cytoskeletal protein CcmA (bactofilin family)